MKIFTTFFSLLFILFSYSTGFSQSEITSLQEQGANLCAQGNIQEGIILLDSAMKKAKSQNAWSLYPEVAIYHWYAFYQLTGNADTVVYELEKIDSIAMQHLPDSLGVLGNIHMYKSMFLYYSGQDRKSMQENEIALSYFEKDRLKYINEISSIYNNLGVLYSAEGNVTKAEDYIKKALALKQDFEKTGKPFDEVSHLSNYLNLAGIYYSEKRFDEFKSYMDLLEKEIAAIPNTPPNIIYRVNQKLVRYYLRNDKNYSAAKEYLNRLQNLSESFDVEIYDIAGTQHLLAEYYLLTKDTAKAEEIWVEATEKIENVLGSQNPRLAEYYINIAEFFGIIEQYDKARFWSNKALELSTHKAGNNLSNMDNQELQMYASAIGTEACLSFFDKQSDKTERLALIEKQGSEYLSTLRAFADRVDKVVSLEAYLDFNTVLTALMEVKYHQYKNDPLKIYDAMELLELKQSLPLLKNQKDIKLAEAANINPKTTDSLNKLSVELERLRSGYSLTNSEEQNRSIANLIDSLNQVKDGINNRVKTQIADAGYRLMEPLETKVTDNEPNQIIADNECLLQFLNDRSELYVIVYSNEDQFIYFSEEPTLNDELIKIRSYLGSISDYDKDSFQAYSHMLYNRLIKPLESYIGTKDLVIMPTGSFNYIPFEVLIKNPSKEKTDYLLRHHPIRYVYSVKTNQPKTNTANQGKQIAFAPDFGNAKNQGYAMRDGFDALAGAKREIENISKSYPFEQYVNHEASKENFLRECQSSQIIHLASHAVVNERHPLRSYVVFEESDSHEKEENYLYAFELYEMNLNADMAVLSACNTGIGKLSTFDGVISLAKAFEFAGVKSTIMSLWPAQDDATADIMSEFYSNLADGQTKSKALQMAKLNYLDNADPIAAQPFFWASFIVQGDNNPIPSSGTNWMSIIIGILGLILVYFIFSRRRSKSSA